MDGWGMDANGSRMQLKSLNSIMLCGSSRFFEPFTVVGLLLLQDLWLQMLLLKESFIVTEIIEKT